MKTHTTRAAIVVMVLTSMLAATPGTLRAEASREYQVKAAFLLNFVQFVEWPEESFENKTAPYVLATLGEDPFDGALEQVVKDKAVNGRTLVVRHYSRVEDVGRCHLLFVSRSENAGLERVFQKIGAAPVLTVGETDQFPWAGGCVRFFIDENKVRFEVNVEAAERARLKISSKLLKLARIFKR